MSMAFRQLGAGARQAGNRVGRLAQDPLLPYRTVRDLYAPADNRPDVFEEMTLEQHLFELRDRIVRILIALVPLFGVAFYFTPRILSELQHKANAVDGMDIRSPTDPLTLYFKVALYLAIAMGMPVIVYQIVGYLAPGLTRKEKRVVFSALPFVAVLFMGGAAYGYFVAAPQALNFLSNFLPGVFSWEPDGRETLSFFLTLMLGLGFSFQLPVIMFILAKLGVLVPRQMRAWRRYAFLLIAIVSAVITPSTDPFNMMLVAIPLYLLYEVGILLSSAFASTTLREAST
jgi:sec-independent protein translocase protein TatC